MLLDLKNLCVSEASTIQDTISIIDSGAYQIALVIDSENNFIGTVTDGDIRRAILRGHKLRETISSIAHKNALTVNENYNIENALSLMRRKKIHHLPIVSQNKKLIGLHTEETSIFDGELPNVAIIMAGGLGERLRPLTDGIPKPMLPIGGKPILEIIVNSLKGYGIKQIIISLNYLGDQIKEHFGDGSNFGLQIEYLNETERSGTAGSLRELRNYGASPSIIINGDVLTRVNFRALLHYHEQSRSDATMCVREHSVQIPYGVVTMKKNHINGIEEKPESKIFINSGIYVLNPQILNLVPDAGIFDMPDLFRTLKESNKTVIAFPIREYWRDIGRIEDYQKANREFSANFPSDD